VAFFDRDVRAATLGLHASRGAEASFADKATARDQRPMTADQIDPLAAPTGQGAVADRQLIESRALEAIVISRGADVADLQLLQRDAGDRLIEPAAVVQIQTIGGLAAQTELANGQIGTTREALPPPRKCGRFSGSSASMVNP